MYSICCISTRFKFDWKYNLFVSVCFKCKQTDSVGCQSGDPYFVYVVLDTSHSLHAASIWMKCGKCLFKDHGASNEILPLWWTNTSLALSAQITTSANWLLALLTHYSYNDYFPMVWNAISIFLNSVFSILVILFPNFPFYRLWFNGATAFLQKTTTTNIVRTHQPTITFRSNGPCGCKTSIHFNVNLSNDYISVFLNANQNRKANKQLI